jgi:hypothetical protein
MTISGELSSKAVPRDDPDGPRHVPVRSRRGRHDGVGSGADRRSVTKTLGWADDDAAQRDYAAALYMLMVVEEESGAGLSSEYARKRAAWSRMQSTEMSPV